MSSADDHIACVIIGAGPAGISAAHWLHSLEVPFRWLSEGGAVGGLLHRVHNAITNFPPECFDSGAALADTFARGLRGCGLAAPEAASVDTVTRVDGKWRLAVANGDALSCDAAILATGTAYRTLGAPGEAEGMGRYVSQSATADGQEFAGRAVAVVGGGDAGFENALRLAEHGCTVHMLLRNEKFRARPAFVERVEAHPNISFSPFPTRVREVLPNEHGCQLVLEVDGERRTLEVACLFVRIGVKPVVPAIEPAPRLRDGFVVVDGRQATSAEGLFAAGDVTDCVLRSVATAVGSGAAAARGVASLLGFL